MRHQPLFRSLPVLLILPFIASPAWAQTNIEVNAGIQFNFSTPGARSLGMGGAFLGLADDATAAYTNPAGLTILTRPEVSFEGRQWQYTHVFTDRGRASGDPTNQGVDSIAGLRDGESSNTAVGSSFLSLVYPRSRWRVALYRHELANFKADFQAQGAFVPNDQNTIRRLPPTRNSLDLGIVNFGAAVAARLNDTISLGVGLSWYEFDLTSRTERFNILRLGVGPGDLYGPPLYDGTNVSDIQTQKGSDHQIGFNAGMLWSAGKWKVGGIYRQGPQFDVEAINETAGVPQIVRHAVFDTPDVYGIGASFQPTEFSTVLLDLVHVEYSDLTESFTDMLPVEPGISPCSGAACLFRIDDSDEIHLGFERNFLYPNHLVALRLGAWYDPDHRIRYDGDNPDFQALFRSGKEEIHYSAGLGYVSSRLNFQVDAAVDVSSRVTTASLSMVVRF